jgi:mannose-1-phosphate guanylyltransferase
MIQPIIIAGGSGTRLWPMSRTNQKQGMVISVKGRTWVTPDSV